MKEKRIQDQIRKRIKEKWPNAWFFKVHGGPYQPAGIPDLVGCINGLFFSFEVKQPKKKATLIQLVTREKIRKAGGISEVVYSADQVEGIIHEAFKSSRKSG